jgi:hypothetical protein
MDAKYENRRDIVRRGVVRGVACPILCYTYTRIIHQGKIQEKGPGSMPLG